MFSKKLSELIKRKNRWFADDADGADEDGFPLLLIRFNQPNQRHQRTLFSKKLSEPIKRKRRWFADNADGADEDGFRFYY
ncbi:hypothetical protein DWW69_02090 [Bacteroides sp. AF16-49]|nr:hypothetical protein DXB63_03240 [Bacteroides sp. OM05-12]RHR82192.1 hypothetical protein DWW69_02090 [Bacteroides sp. AF16-49]